MPQPFQWLGNPGFAAANNSAPLPGGASGNTSLPPAGGNYIAPFNQGQLYGSGVSIGDPRYEGAYGGGNSFTGNWQALPGAQQGPPSAQISGGGNYPRPGSNGLPGWLNTVGEVLGRTPIGQAAHGVFNVATGRWDDIPAVRIARSIGHLFDGTLGQHDWRTNAQSGGGGAGAQPAGRLPSALANLFSGQPINQANFANFTQNTAHPGQGFGQGTNAWQRSGTGNWSPQDLARARSAEAGRDAANAAYAGTPNFTGNTQDAGHNIFNINQRGGGQFLGRMVAPEEGGDPILEHYWSAGTGRRPQPPTSPSIAELLRRAGGG